jgi:hypothetical protein
LVWSGEEMEIAHTEYLSHFREYKDREHRGLLYEKLRSRTIHLVLVATPRLLEDEETPQLAPESLNLPPGTILPELDNVYGVPLKGTITVGFELDASGKPVNPQVVWSTLPEANPRILGESLNWSFPRSVESPEGRRWGQVDVPLEIR